jgi:hypothetical protein
MTSIVMSIVVPKILFKKMKKKMNYQCIKKPCYEIVRFYAIGRSKINYCCCVLDYMAVVCLRFK